MRADRITKAALLFALRTFGAGSIPLLFRRFRRFFCKPQCAQPRRLLVIGAALLFQSCRLIGICRLRFAAQNLFCPLSGYAANLSVTLICAASSGQTFIHKEFRHLIAVTPMRSETEFGGLVALALHALA